MFGQDTPTSLLSSDIQGLLQDEAAKFLQLRSKLNEMGRSPVLTISDKANQLLVTQSTLENSVADITTKAQTGNLSDMFAVATYAYQVESQISDVNDLWNQYQGLGSSAKAGLIPGIPNWAMWIVGGGLVFIMIRRKRKGVK